MEALVVLVALRAWRKLWASRRRCLSFRGDNVTASTLVIRTKLLPGNIKAVAKEIALALSVAVLRPKTVSRTPGIAHMVTDVLSRKYEPTRKEWASPQELKGFEEVVPADRTSDWYLLAQPPQEQMGYERS